MRIVMHAISIRVRLDVDIEALELYCVPIPNLTSIGNGRNTKSIVWMYKNSQYGIEGHLKY